MECTRFLFILGLSMLLLPACNEGSHGKDEGFSIEQVDESLLSEVVSKKVFDEHSPVSADRLRLLHVRHYGFEDQVQNGELMVLDACSEHVKKIFEELYERKFAIEKVKLIAEYGGSDSLSMADNNTSAHNLRAITGGERLSLHAFGTAIDLNPVQNPYIDIPCKEGDGVVRFQPVEGVRYANRRQNRPGKKNRKGLAEDVIATFARHGFYIWGGYWDCPIDYQHFQVSRTITEVLVAMEPEEAGSFFNTVADYYNKHQVPIEDALESELGPNMSLVALYKADADRFRDIVSGL